ncbi:hypothetical protein AAMO2058_001322300 [Amorphochlora amoebiformis]
MSALRFRFGLVVAFVTLLPSRCFGQSDSQGHAHGQTHAHTQTHTNEATNKWIVPDYKAQKDSENLLRFRSKRAQATTIPSIPSHALPTQTNTYLFKSQVWGPYETIQSSIPTVPGGTSHLEYHHVHSLTAPGSPQYFVKDLYKAPSRIYDARNPMPMAVMPQSISPFMVPKPQVPYFRQAPLQPQMHPYVEILHKSKQEWLKDRMKDVNRNIERPSPRQWFKGAAGA